MLQQLQQNVLFSVRGFSGGKNADKSRPTASAKSRYARQNSHLFSCFLPRDSHTMRISSSFTAKSCAVCLSASLPEKSGSVPCEETILFVNVAAIKIGNGSVYSNEFCVPGKPINPNLLRKKYAAKAARIQQLRAKSAVFPCVVSVAACFL